MRERIGRHFSFLSLKEEARKIGVNFITAGVVGVFVYHYVGSEPMSMFWASMSITAIGVTALYFGTRKWRGRP